MRRRIHLAAVLMLIPGANLPGAEIGQELAACNGSASCKVCTNCSRCRHCKAGGSCGVCSKNNLGSVLIALAGDPPKPEVPSEPEMIRDRNWTPTPGDRVEVYEDNTPACTTWLSFDAFMKHVDSHDEVGIAQFYANKVAVKLPKGTGVLVVKSTRPAPIVSSRPLTGAEVGRQLQRDVLTPERRGEYPLQVRILDGEFKDQLRYVPEEFLARMVPAPKPIAPPVKPKPKPIAPEVRAATLIRLAENLERVKKVAGAVNLYREVVKDFPGTPQASAAAARIETLSRP